MVIIDQPNDVMSESTAKSSSPPNSLLELFFISNNYVSKSNLDDNLKLSKELVMELVVYFYFKLYQNPVSPIVFNTQEFAQWIGKDARKFYRLRINELKPYYTELDGDNASEKFKVVKSKLKEKNINSYMDFILRELFDNPLVLKSYAEVSDKTKKVTRLSYRSQRIIKNLSIITVAEMDQVHKTYLENTKGRGKWYEITLDKDFKKGLASLSYPVSITDWSKISSRNGSEASTSTLKRLYSYMAKALQELEYKGETYSSFDELKDIHNYHGTDAKRSKFEINKNINILLDMKLDSLKGLKFKWVKSKNANYPYTPVFELDQQAKVDKRQSERELFKRVDSLLITEYKELTNDERGDYIINGTPDYKMLKVAHERAYEIVMRRKPSSDEYGLFASTFTYKEKHVYYHSFLVYCFKTHRKMVESPYKIQLYDYIDPNKQLKLFNCAS